jgi:ribonuclease E
VEKRYCPTCLTRLGDGEALRCPECRSRLQRARPIVVEEGARIPAQLLDIVERELQARIEAKMATGYRQRRRAAKVARRLASLPTALLQGEVVEEPPEPQARAPRPTYVSPIIVDLPDAAVREVRSIAAVAEPVAEIVIEPVAEIVADPVEEVVVVAEAPGAERAPRPPRGRPRRRAPEAPRHREPRPVVEVETEIVVAPEPAEEATVEEATVEEATVEEATVEEATVEAPVVDLPEEPEVAEQPDIGDPVPVAPRAWQPSNPVWRERVFNSAHTRRETVTWPRPRAANGDFRGR